MSIEIKAIWIIGEYSEGKLHEVSLEVLSEGFKLARELDGQVNAVIVGSENDETARVLGAHGAARVCFIHSPLLEEYRVDRYVEAFSKFFQSESPEAIIIGATPVGRDLAPRLAARLKTGLISECTGLALDRNRVISGTRLSYGGKVSSTVICPDSRPLIATLRQGVISTGKPDPGRKAEITVITLDVSSEEYGIRIEGIVKADPEKIGLDEVEVIVAGGRGVSHIDNFKLLEDLAKRLGGVVAGSLGAIDEGWLPHKKLIGQTGTTVAPKLYIACGISGSIYHVLGIRDSNFVIAINKDPNAPIFKVADMSVIGDVSEVLSALIDRLPAVNRNTTG